jgi:hypothetical protein
MTLALTHAGYLAAGWGIGLGALGIYALSLVRRGRRLAQHVAPEDRRWS